MDNSDSNNDITLFSFGSAETGETSSQTPAQLGMIAASDSKAPVSGTGTLGNLYQITQTIHHLESLLIESGGELTPEIEAEFSAIKIAQEQKVDSYAAILDRFSSIESEYRKKVQTLQKIINGAKAVQERLKRNLKSAMFFMSVKEINGVDTKFELSAVTETLKIDNEGEIPVSYCDEITTYVPNKERITAALKAGEQVPGTHLEPSQRLIRGTPTSKKGK